MNDDAELLRRYVERHDQAAFAELVRQRINLVYSVAVRQCGGDTHLAEDVTQRVFADLARKARSLIGHTVLSGWMCQSARFAASDVVRAETRRRHREQESLVMNDRSDHGVVTDTDTLRFLLDELLSKLSEMDRDAIALRYFEQRSLADVGSTLRLSPDAARKRVDRALEKIREMLARRGITSTAAALAIALEQQAAVAAPAGLAATTIAAIPMPVASGLHGAMVGTLAVAVGALLIGGWVWHERPRRPDNTVVDALVANPASVQNHSSIMETVLAKLPPAPPLTDNPEPAAQDPTTSVSGGPVPAKSKEATSNSIIGVFGAVEHEGTMTWKRGMTLQQALAAAGEPSQATATFDVQVTRIGSNGTPTTLGVPLNRADTWLMSPGDIVFVTAPVDNTPEALDSSAKSKASEKLISLPTTKVDPAALLASISIMGRVTRPGHVLWSEGLTLHQVITAAGGPTKLAALTKISVTRRRADGRVDRLTASMLQADDFVMAPGDMVYVPERIL
jgi:RNA polymerase sigma factor (sigma-70 family)